MQGRFDEMRFEGAVGDALGSQTAAQGLRAQGRALRVVSWLHDAGVAPNRIRELPPPSTPSWRGVQVSLLPDCVPAPEPVAATPDAEQVRVAVREALEKEPELAEGRAPHTIQVTLPPPEPDEPGPWWLSAGGGVGGMFADGTDDVAAGITRLGVGRTDVHTYVYLQTGLTFGSATGQSRGLESTLGLGWHRNWLYVGARAGHRISSSEYSDPWSDQAWFGGLEGAQCLAIAEGLLACAEEMVGGGQWTQRAVELGDTFYFVPEEERAALLLGFTLALRQGL